MKIGLVLSGGGARGFAHIGVLKVLKENNITIDYVAGCSAGALVGACYAHNQDITQLEKLASNIKSIYDVIDFSFSSKGFAKGEKIEKYITDFFQNREQNKKDKDTKKMDNVFEDLKIPLVINATDIAEGTEVIFGKGPLLPAIMASMSYPGLFQPRLINKQLLVDGGVINPLPLKLIENQIEYLIIVDVSESEVDITEKSNAKDILIKAIAITQGKIVEQQLKECHKKYVLIKPELHNVTIIDFKNTKELIKAGESAARISIEQIKKDLKSFEA